MLFSLYFIFVEILGNFPVIYLMFNILHQNMNSEDRHFIFGTPWLDHRVKKDHKNMFLKQQMQLKPAVSSPAAIKQESSYNPTL